jgi:AcrR family transcriptional regulator
MMLFCDQTVNAKKKGKPYHQENLSEQLLEACERALTEMPIEAVSLREIARRAGVSHAAPKHHFESLGHLFAQVAARGFERFIGALQLGAERNVSGDAEMQLVNMGCAYVEFAKHNAAVYGLMFGKREAMVVTPELKAAMRKAWTQLEQAAAEVVDSPRAALAATTIWAAMHGLATLKQSRRLPAAAASPERDMMRAIIAGLKVTDPNNEKRHTRSNRK